MHREIGGYFELDTYYGKEYYPDAIPLNSGRNAIALLIKARAYTKVYVPSFCCDVVVDGVSKGGAQTAFYAVDENLMPIFPVQLGKSEALLLINYYGQLDDHIVRQYKEKYDRIILDNTQAFFQKALPGIDTVYSCRKFFGVSDGAYLSADIVIDKSLEMDRSAKRMNFVLGRFEEPASNYYAEASANNEVFTTEPIKYMSKITHNLLKALDYSYIAEVRKSNADYLHKKLEKDNCLSYRITGGDFMYPFLLSKKIDGAIVRKALQQKKIYVPCLWPNVLESETQESTAYYLANNIIPLPCDQRYNNDDMQYIVDILKNLI
jgi:hypothetical protein